VTAESLQAGPVGLVLAGGGARGAYEIGALSVLLPALEQRGERPRVLVGTSVGALNTAYLAATADRPVGEVSEQGERIWRETTFRDVLSPVLSVRALGRSLRFAGQLLSVRGPSLPAILDPAPLQGTLERLIPFARIEPNVESGALHAAAVVTTSALTSRTVVFHHGGAPPGSDGTRAIDYVAAELREPHVRASAAIPALFPAVHLEQPAAGWYFDGGTRLNTPIKPALALGAERVVVIALDSVAPGPAALAGERRPDAVEGAAQFLQAVLVDPLVNDVRTLAGINRQVLDAGGDGGERSVVPYILIAPEGRETVGEIAMNVFREHYSRLRDLFRARDLALLGRAIAGGSDPVHGSLLSLLFFAPEFAEALLELGRADARRWLNASHHDGPWELAGPSR
jgi:NTE family protein